MPEQKTEPAETSSVSFQETYSELAPAVEQAGLTEDVADEQGTHTEPANPDVTAQSAKPETKTGYSYAVGDTVYLDNTAFRIEHIAFFNVRLLDLSAAYPISRVEHKQRFENLLLNDERNARFLPREDRKEAPDDTVKDDHDRAMRRDGLGNYLDPKSGETEPADEESDKLSVSAVEDKEAIIYPFQSTHPVRGET